MIYPVFLDKGEASSIGLFKKLNGDLLIIDELKGRKAAKDLDIPITGSLGILILAKEKGYISAVQPLIERIRQTNFHISEELIKRTLEIANEAEK